MLDANVTKRTTVIELKGIRMAAKIGVNKPCTAKVNPTIL
jgi:tRNA A-37 threonylcarbamoyl transferase component Bud32|tara:strand:- start:142 stop:261 length:120 start_codon:yes stop_codon:yes gene_type:complete